MSVDEDKILPENATGEREEDSGIWSTATAVMGDDTAIERGPLEIARAANRLAWIAIWVAVVAVVISVASAVFSLPL